MLGIILTAVLLVGPVEASISRVVDGDTYQVQARTWLDTQVTTFIRLKGIDTPERDARAKCPKEAELASKASTFVKDILKVDTLIYISNIEYDKYGGRVLADVRVGDQDLAKLLIDQGYARSYDGKKKESWCK